MSQAAVLQNGYRRVPAHLTRGVSIGWMEYFDDLREQKSTVIKRSSGSNLRKALKAESLRMLLASRVWSITWSCLRWLDLREKILRCLWIRGPVAISERGVSPGNGT